MPDLPSDTPSRLAAALRAPFSSHIPWWPFLGGLAKDARMKAIGSDILGSGGIASR